MEYIISFFIGIISSLITSIIFSQYHLHLEFEAELLKIYRQMHYDIKLMLTNCNDFKIMKRFEKRKNEIELLQSFLILTKFNFNKKYINKHINELMGYLNNCYIKYVNCRTKEDKDKIFPFIYELDNMINNKLNKYNS